MLELGAESILPSARAPMAGAVPSHLTGREAVGWQLGVYFLGAGEFVRGQVVAFSTLTGRHHVAYQDGEDEWIQLESEALQWHGLTEQYCLSLPSGTSPVILLEAIEMATSTHTEAHASIQHWLRFDSLHKSGGHAAGPRGIA